MHHNARKPTLLDMLDPKSLEVLKNFGHIYVDPVTKRKKMRTFSHPKILNQNGQPNRNNQHLGS